MRHAFLCGRLSSLFWGFPGGSVVKNLPANAGDRVWSLSWEDPLEKETATHSSILAWEIPRTEEPGALRSMGRKRVRHNLETKQLFAVLYWINAHFLFHSIILIHLCPEECTLLSFGLPCSSDGKASAYNAGNPGSIPGSVTSWQKWDSCAISPLSDSTHSGWFCSQSFYKCWQQSFIFKHREQRPWMCSAVVNTVPEANLLLAGEEWRPQLQEYCRPLVARLT